MSGSKLRIDNRSKIGIMDANARAVALSGSNPKSLSAKMADEEQNVTTVAQKIVRAPSPSSMTHFRLVTASVGKKIFSHITSLGSGASLAVIAKGCAANREWIASSFAVGFVKVTKAVLLGRKPSICTLASSICGLQGNAILKKVINNEYNPSFRASKVDM